MINKWKPIVGFDSRCCFHCCLTKNSALKSSNAYTAVYSSLPPLQFLPVDFFSNSAIESSVAEFLFRSAQEVFTLMMPKNLMDNKQLNLNQPLLSVRRGSSTALPEVDRRKASNPPPALPPLPYYKSELKSGPVRNPGVVPFRWEQIPGRPKDERKLQNEAHERLGAAPKLPPGRAMNNDENPSDKPVQESAGSKSQLEYNGTTASDSSSLHKNAGEFERAEDAREENGSSISEGESSTYVDALDSLSRSESFFLNCSLTGVSGLDGPSTKPDGTFSDPLARDLMMDRFLPAAKAVASETPHFGSKKQSVAKEQPREFMTLDKHNPRYYYTPISLPQHSQEEEGEDTEEEEEDNYYGGNENASVKLCGLLPRFCLLNPIPGMRDQVPRPISSVRKTHKKPANAGAFNKTDKAIRDAVYERKRLAVYKKSGMRIEADRLKHELNELYPQSQCSTSGIPRQFLGIPEAAKDSKASSKPTSRRKAHTRSPEFSADETAQEKPALAKPTREKTLYIDSAQVTEYRDSNSSSSESRSLTDSRGRNPSIDYSLHDIKDLCCADNMIPSQSQNVDSFQDHKPDSYNRLPDADAQLLPLPLPKSPSESWLSRALPSVSSRNQRSYVNSGNLGFRSSPVNPRWESIDKSSNKNFGLPALTPISEN